MFTNMLCWKILARLVESTKLELRLSNFKVHFQTIFTEYYSACFGLCCGFLEQNLKFPLWNRLEFVFHCPSWVVSCKRDILIYEFLTCDFLTHDSSNPPIRFDHSKQITISLAFGQCFRAKTDLKPLVQKSKGWNSSNFCFASSEKQRVLVYCVLHTVQAGLALLYKMII